MHADVHMHVHVLVCVCVCRGGGGSVAGLRGPYTHERLSLSLSFLGGEDSPAALRASPRHRIVGVAAEQVAGALPLAAGLPEVSTEEEREHWQGACARGVYWLLGCTFNPFMFSWDREVLIKYKVRLVTALHSTHGPQRAAQASIILFVCARRLLSVIIKPTLRLLLICWTKCGHKLKPYIFLYTRPPRKLNIISIYKLPNIMPCPCPALPVPCPAGAATFPSTPRLALDCGL